MVTRSSFTVESLLSFADPDGDGSFRNFENAMIVARFALLKDGNDFIARWADKYLARRHKSRAKREGYASVADDGWQRGWIVLQRKWRSPPAWARDLQTYSNWVLRILHNESRNEQKTFRPRRKKTDLEKEKQQANNRSADDEPTTCLCERGEHPLYALSFSVVPDAAMALPDNCSHELEQLEMLPELKAAIEQLPAISRDIVEMLIGAMTKEEMAKVLGIPLKTVKGRITRALRRLGLMMSDSGVLSPTRSKRDRSVYPKTCIAES